MQQVFLSGDDQCWVILLESQMCKCPAKFCPRGPLYFRHLKKSQAALYMWYSEQPVGESKLKEFMKTIGWPWQQWQEIHKPQCTKDTGAYIAKGRSAINAITAHKSEQSIAEYADSDLEDHQKLSLLMHDSCSYLPVLHTEFSHIRHHVGGSGCWGRLLNKRVRATFLFLASRNTKLFIQP